jgi:hypothetical protein
MAKINYSKNNYCRVCEIKYPIDVFRCIARGGCGMKIRTTARKQKRSYEVHPRAPINIGTEIKQVYCKSTNPKPEHRY